ncbi:MAG TPA: hypothetical protein VJ953_00650 [Saprospiraceae bacterium]|nr:hypothetical protein [Saprospiraceae bacterium]
MSRLSFSICLFFLCAQVTLIAQRIMVSDELPLRSDISYEIIGEFGEQVLLFRDKSVSFEVQAFDENMRSSWTKEIELLKRSPEVIGINSIRDSFTLFYQHRDRGDFHVRAYRYNAKAALKDSVLISVIDNTFQSPDMEILRSEDRNKILLYNVDRQKEIHAILFDNEKMEKVWEYRFEPQEFRYSEDALHMAVSNAGDMYVVIEKANYRVKKDDYNYEVFKYGPGSTGILRHIVSIGEYFTFDLAFNYDNVNQQLVAGGFYYEKNPLRAEGFFSLHLDSSLKDEQLTFHPFRENIVESLVGKELRKNRGLEEVVIQDVVLRRDGGMVIIGEENKNYYRRMANAGRGYYSGFTRNVTDFYFNDVFALSVSPQGTIDWQTIMHKKQFSQDDGGVYSSYFLFKNPRNLRLIFNDEIKLENTVSEYILAGTGAFNRNSILSTDNQNLRLRFRDALQISPTKMLVPSEHRGKLRIARLEL